MNSAKALRISSYILCGLIAIGLFLRIRRPDLPETLTFDEWLFVKNAHHYLIGLPDDNDHPPLGKLLMAIGHLFFDFNSLGWRFTSLCFGVTSVYIGYLLGTELFRDKRAGYFAAALIAADGFFIAYSRAGLLDGVLCCLILWTILAAVTARTFQDVLITAVLLGLAISVKWSAAFAVFPAAIALERVGKLPRHWILALGVSVPVHIVVWMFGLWVVNQPNDFATVVDIMKRLYRHHLDLGNRDNDLASKWYSWIILYHPIVVKLSNIGAKSRYASSVGNPLMFLLASATVIALPLYFGARTLLSEAKTRYRKQLGKHLAKLPDLPSLFPAHVWDATLVLAGGWFFMIAPWMVARGKYTFYYHYLPSYSFALLLLAGLLTQVEKLRPRAITGLLAVSAAIVIFFVPVWGEFPITKETANQRLRFKGWKP